MDPKTQLPKSALALCALLATIPNPVFAQEFLKETFEDGGLNNTWTQPGGIDTGWSQWPAEAEPCNTLAKVAHGGSKSLYVKNLGADDYYIRTGSISTSPDWLEATQGAKVTYHRFYFKVPDEAASNQGFALTFALKEISSEPFNIGAFVGVVNDEKQGRAVLASAGTGDGQVQWEKVGTWEPGEWVRIDVIQHYDTHTYDVQVGDQTVATGMNFRSGQTWVGETWGDKAQAHFQFPPASQVYLDDIRFSTRPIVGK